MTENEFLKLDIGTVISKRCSKTHLYVIYDTDQFGTSYRGDIYRVFGAEKINTDINEYIRIDIMNYSSKIFR